MAEKAKEMADNAVDVVDTSIKPAVPRSELEIRKSNEAIGLRVVSGRLTLLNRKVFNVLMYHAQRIRKLGQDAPIDTPAAQNISGCPCRYLHVTRVTTVGTCSFCASKFLKCRTSSFYWRRTASGRVSV